MIPLMKNAFLGEKQTRKALAEFILHAPRLSMDAKCLEFEAAFAAQEGRKSAVLFNSGGSANLAMIQALKNLGRLKDGDKVGFSAMTWSTNIMPLIQLGLRPVPVDCDPSTLNVMSGELARVIAKENLKGMFLTNVLGFCGDLPAIRDLCRAEKVILIEDNCESLGTVLPEGRAGSFGLMSSFSFYIAHHMSTIEGGLTCVDDPELDEMLRIVRANGWDRNLTATQQAHLRSKHGIVDEFQSKYTFYDLGYNLRPTEITGFLGLEQLKHLDAAISAREANYTHFENCLKKCPDLLRPNRSHIRRLSNFSFPVLCRTPQSRRLHQQRFLEAGIEIRPLIAGNMTLQPFYAKYVGGPLPALPGTDFFHNNAFYFGNYPELSPSDIATIESCLLATDETSRMVYK